MPKKTSVSECIEKVMAVMKPGEAANFTDILKRSGVPRGVLPTVLSTLVSQRRLEAKGAARAGFWVLPAPK